MNAETSHDSAPNPLPKPLSIMTHADQSNAGTTVKVGVAGLRRKGAFAVVSFRPEADIGHPGEWLTYLPTTPDVIFCTSKHTKPLTALRKGLCTRRMALCKPTFRATNTSWAASIKQAPCRPSFPTFPLSATAFGSPFSMSTGGGRSSGSDSGETAASTPDYSWTGQAWRSSAKRRLTKRSESTIGPVRPWMAPRSRRVHGSHSKPRVRCTWAIGPSRVTLLSTCSGRRNCASLCSPTRPGIGNRSRAPQTTTTLDSSTTRSIMIGQCTAP